MSEPTYKEFLDQVRSCIDGFSEADLRNLILNWARTTDYSDRNQFLRELNRASCKEWDFDGEEFLVNIEEFAAQVQSGAYCTGWGWDDEYGEERDWGDESWAEEMDRLFRMAQNLVRHGECTVAGQAYKMLFEILEMAEEPGHLPGDPNPYNMLTVDLDEQLALFLRALYSTWDASARPSLLFAEIRKQWGSIGRMGLRAIMECVDSPLPEQDIFLADWVQFLAEQSVYPITQLMREAVQLRDGVAGLIELAQKNPAKYSEGYLDWITVLEGEGNHKKVLEVAREALIKIPGGLAIRAQIGEFISTEGERQNNHQLILEGYAASFFAAPTVEYLLDLYLTALENDTFIQIQDEVIQKVGELRSQNKRGWEGGSNELTFLSNRMYFHTLVLSGDYEQLFDLCHNRGPLGWSTGDNPRPFLILLLLLLLSRGGTYRSVLTKQWEHLVWENSYVPDQRLWEKYNLVLQKVYNSLEFTDERQKSYLDWCLKQLDARVHALVSNHYRTSYYKGAELVVAVAETLMNLSRKSDAIRLINRYHEKYSKFSSFRRELRQAVQIAGIL